MASSMREQIKSPAQWTIGTVLNWTASYLQTKGIKTGRLDAEILLAHCLGVDRLYLYLNFEKPLLPDERLRFREFVKRRGSREPVALIIGKKEFWSTSLRIRPGVLIPRPETEILVEAVLLEIKENPLPEVLEIGTGSGAIAIAIAKENPRAKILATDIDFTVVETAKWNVEHSGIKNDLQFVAAKFFEGFRDGPFFDVICSNPPYIPTNMIRTLEPDVRDFEPVRALDGGLDGLDAIRSLAVESIRFLKRPGALALEFGDGQKEAVREILLSAGFEEIRTYPDLAGKNRAIVGKLL